MKNLIVKTSLVCSLLVSSAAAFAKGPLGIGAIIGDPTGVSAKYYLSKDTAIDGAVAWSLGDKGALGLHASYLLHVPAMVRVKKSVFPLHYGIGAILLLSEHGNGFGVRAPVGLNYNFERHPIDIFLEFAGILVLAPKTDFDIHLALGARYYF